MIAETAFHLGDSRIVLQMIDEGLLCIVRRSELHPKHSVITTDREGFRICRRNKRDTIPLICPV